MPSALPKDYFYRDPWTASGPLRLRKYTCMCCGHTSFSWEAFRIHRILCDVYAEGQAGVTGQPVLSAAGDVVLPPCASPVAAH